MIRLSHLWTFGSGMKLPFLFYSLLACAAVSGQPACPYSPLIANRIAGSYWKYIHMTHASSGQVLHKGEDDYPSYLHFRFDHTARLHTNGFEEETDWMLHRGLLKMSYRGKKHFCTDLSPSGHLVLSFQREGSPTTYEYHFREVVGEETPFEKPKDELPTVLLDEPKNRSRTQHHVPWWAFWRLWQRPPPPPERVFIPMSLEISGGGYYGGLNPIHRQFLHIDSEGRLIREIHTRHEGLLKTRKTISRRELEDFIAWIDRNGFFELEQEYDCKDPICFKRKTEQPRPVPLQMAIRLGHQRKVVTVHIWGRDHLQEQWLPYPPLIDQIIYSAYKMADRPD